MLTVRTMIARDYAGVRRVDIETQREFRGPDWDTLSAEEQDSSRMSESAAADLYEASGLCLVAEDDGSIVGFLLAYREPFPAYGRVYVEGIAVAPDRRQSGIGSELYAELRQRAKAQGIREIRALITPGNGPSIALHESVGFAIRDRKEAELEL